MQDTQLHEEILSIVNLKVRSLPAFAPKTHGAAPICSVTLGPRSTYLRPTLERLAIYKRCAGFQESGDVSKNQDPLYNTQIVELFLGTPTRRMDFAHHGLRENRIRIFPNVQPSSQYLHEPQGHNMLDSLRPKYIPCEGGCKSVLKWERQCVKGLVS